MEKEKCVLWILNTLVEDLHNIWRGKRVCALRPGRQLETIGISLLSIYYNQSCSIGGRL